MAKDNTQKEDIAEFVVDFTGINKRKAKLFATRLLKEYKPKGMQKKFVYI